MSGAASPAHRLLIVGGQKSGKSRHAEQRAAAWLAASPRHRAVFIATAVAGDAEMRARIERHRADRAAHLPTLRTVEEPLALAAAIRAHGTPETLLVVDCLTLWLVNLLAAAPAIAAENSESKVPQALMQKAPAAMEIESLDDIADALCTCAGPVVMVSNEIGLGVVPMGREVRAFVDALGLLNQRIAALSDEVVLMAAGLPLVLKPRGAA